MSSPPLPPGGDRNQTARGQTTDAEQPLTTDSSVEIEQPHRSPLRAVDQRPVSGGARTSADLWTTSNSPGLNQEIEELSAANRRTVDHIPDATAREISDADRRFDVF